MQGEKEIPIRRPNELNKRKKIAILIMISLFLSSVSCLISPVSTGAPKSSQTGRLTSCRVLRLTNESKILRYIQPDYPRNASAIRGDIIVYLKADTDQEGRVKDVRFFWSDKSFGEAAALAISQWVFEPILIDEKPAESSHAIKILFQSENKKVVAKAWHYPDEFRVYELPFQNRIARPATHVLHKVDPIYPVSARLQNIEGIISMEALFSEAGRVESILLWDSIPELEESAIEAFSQWIYEPLIINNTPTKFVAAFHVRFHRVR